MSVKTPGSNGRIFRLHFFGEALDLNDGAFVRALTNHFSTEPRLHAKFNTPVRNLREFRRKHNG